MHFENPLLLLLGIPAAAGIVVMYILKLRRKDIIVSSTFLWRQVIRDVQANAPFQKLRRNLLMILQLLAAALVIFAIARPFRMSLGRVGRSIVVIIDHSASMRATDVRPTRLDEAKKKARQLVSEMAPNDRMLIVAAGARPITGAAGFSSQRGDLYRDIDLIPPTDTQTNMSDALSLAGNLVSARDNGENGRIVVISDGAFEGQEAGAAAPVRQFLLSAVAAGKARIDFVPIGASGENVGITALDYRRTLTDQNPGVEVLVVTHNFGTKASSFVEEIYADDRLIDAHPVTLAAGADDTQPFALPEPAQTIHLRAQIDAKDDLSVDNEADLILKPRKPVKVLVIGIENEFLLSALTSDPGLQVSRATTYSGAAGNDVVVFVDNAPAHLPEGRYLFIHCTSDRSPVHVTGSQQNVAPADWDREHPILRFVDFGSERFGSALQAEPLNWAKELAVAESGTLIAAGETGKTRSEFVAFALNELMFPLRVAFPIFIDNSIQWLAGTDINDTGQVHTGEPISITAPPGLALTVTRPDGATERIQATDQGTATYTGTDLVGLYKAHGDHFDYSFVANLTSNAESDITPHRFASVVAADGPAQRLVKIPTDLLPLGIAIALSILCFEWWAFHRRVFVN